MENNFENTENNLDEVIVLEQPDQPMELPIVDPERRWYKNKVLWTVIAVTVIVAGGSTAFTYYSSLLQMTTTSSEARAAQ